MVFVSVRSTTRDLLIEAAIEIMDREGEAGLRVDTVTEKVGVTKPSLYHFFGDREGLVSAAYAEMYRRSLIHGLREFHDAIMMSASPEEYRDILLRTAGQFTDEGGVHRRAVRTMVLGSAVTRPVLREAIVAINREEVDLLGRAFEVGVRRGWTPFVHDPRTVAYWWWGMINGRHLVEIDDQVDASGWDAVNLAAVVGVIYPPG